MKECEKALEWFWIAFEELSPEDKIHFIQHWTGNAKIPAGGVKEMKLQIRDRSYEKHRIFAHTCFNRIYMPDCDTEEQLKEAVQMAVNSVKQGLSIQED